MGSTYFQIQIVRKSDGTRTSDKLHAGAPAVDDRQKGLQSFISVGFPPAIKMDGEIKPVSKTELTPETPKHLPMRS